MAAVAAAQSDVTQALNDAVTRARARALELEPKLAALIEPLLVRYGNIAARNFAKYARDHLSAAADPAAIKYILGLIEERKEALSRALEKGDIDKIRLAKRALQSTRRHLFEISGQRPDTATWVTPYPNQLVNVEGLAKAFGGKTDPVRNAFVKSASKDMVESAGVAWDVSNPLIGKALAETGAHITSIAETTRENVMGIVRESYDQGLSIRDTSLAIQAGMREASSARATLIARTEMTRAVNSASLAAVEMVDNASPEGSGHWKVWLTAPGAKHARHETYAGLGGQTVKLNAFFDVGGANLLYPGDPNGPAGEVCNCFPAETLVRVPRLRAVMRRWYEGDLVRVRLASGDELAATPNHPVLDGSGTWQPIGALREGDDVVRATITRQTVGAPDEENPPAEIGELYRLAHDAGIAERVVVRPGDLHGDAVTDGEVDVVRVDGSLLGDEEAASDEKVAQFGFALASAARAASRRREMALLDGHGSEMYWSAASGAMGGCRQGEAIILCQLRKSEPVGLRARADRQAELGETQQDRSSTDAEFLRDPQDAVAAVVSLAEIVEVERYPFQGWVYNVDTGEGWLEAQSIAAGNCRCALAYTDEAPESETGGTNDDWIPPPAQTSVEQEFGLGPGVDTLTKYTDPATGQWTPERQALNDEIAAWVLRNAMTKEDPEAIFTAGGTSVGKSSILDRLDLDDAALARKHIVKIDPDEIKARYPEYQRALELGDENAAGYVHEESSKLAKQIMDYAYEHNYDVIVDGTGDGKVGDYLKKIQRAKDLGYRTRVVFVDAPWKDANILADQRFKSTGRRVDKDLMRDIHDAVAKRFPEWSNSEAVDQWEMHVNEVVGYDKDGRAIVKAKLVARRPLGRYAPTDIYDEDKFRASMRKGVDLEPTPPETPVPVLDITAPDPADLITGNKTISGQRKAEKFLAGRDLGDSPISNVTPDERVQAKIEIAQKLTRRLQNSKEFQQMYGIAKVKMASQLEVGDVVRPLHGNPGDVIEITEISKAYVGLKTEEVIHYRVVKSVSDSLGGVGYEGTFSRKLETEWAIQTGEEQFLGIYPPVGRGQSAVEQGVSGLIDQWAATSADEDFWAIAMQKAVQDEFGLNPQAFGGFVGRVRGDVLQDADKLYALYGGGLRAFVRAMYEQTQQELREQGINEVILYRGTRVRGNNYLSPGEIRPNGMAKQPAEFQPASSFSTDYKTGLNFSNLYAGHGEGSLMAARVPAARILASARTGWGCLHEGEYIVLADRPGYKSEMWVFNSSLGKGRLLTPDEVSAFWDYALRHQRGIPFAKHEYRDPPDDISFPPQPHPEPGDLPW